LRRGGLGFWLSRDRGRRRCKLRSLRLGRRRGGLRLRCRRSTPGAGGGRLHVLALAGQHRDHLINRHVRRAFSHHDLGDRPLVDSFDFHGGFVGFDLGDDVAGFDLVALFLQPLGKVALFHRGRQRRHEDVDRHGVSASFLLLFLRLYLRLFSRISLWVFWRVCWLSPGARPSRRRMPRQCRW
jgi:hypothetical protein